MEQSTAQLRDSGLDRGHHHVSWPDGAFTCRAGSRFPRGQSLSGAKLGAACGILFFAIATVLETAAMAVMHTGNQVREKVMEALQQAAARSNDAQVQAAFEQFKTPQGIALMLVLGVFVLLIISIAAGSLAGALTGAVLGRKRP
jgi:hypothetical protein